MHWLDVVVMLVYFAGLAAMALYFKSKNTGTEEYFVGGRSFSGVIIGISLVGTAVSSITFLAYPADAFKTTWVRFTPNIMLLVSVFFAAFVFLPFFMRGKITSAYEYLGDRFGPSIRTYGAVTFIFGELVRISIVLYLLALLVHEITGVAPFLAIIIAGVFVSLYTVIGGIDTVIWTDVIQVIVFVVGGLVCLGLIVWELPGGFGQIISVGVADGKLTLAEAVDGQTEPLNFGLSFHEKTVSMMLILGLLNWLKHYCANQTIIQRYVSSKNESEARKAMFIAAFLRVPIWAFFFFLGTALYVYFKEFPTPEAMAMLNGEQKAEQILPFFIINYLPAGLSGVVLAAALAAAMSSLDSSINSISTIAVTDLYKRYFKKGADDGHYLNSAYIFASCAGLCMVLGATILLRTETKTVEHIAVMLASMLTGGMLGIYLLGFLTKVGDARSVGMGIAFAIAFTIWTILSGAGHLPRTAAYPFDLYFTSLFVNFGVFIVGFLAALVFPKRPRDLTNLTVWDVPRASQASNNQTEE